MQKAPYGDPENVPVISTKETYLKMMLREG